MVGVGNGSTTPLQLETRFGGQNKLEIVQGTILGAPNGLRSPRHLENILDFSQKLLTNPIVGRAAPPKGNPLFEIAEAELYDNRHR